MNAFLNHLSFEFRTGIRNKTLLLLNYLFPLGFYVMMGVIMAQINPMYLETMLPAMVVFAIVAATMLGLPDPLVTAREAGIFRSYKINGVPALSILVIPALTTILHAAAVAGIITITAPLLFDAPSPVHWPAFILTFILMAFACAGLAVLIGVISPSSRMTVLWSQLIFLPSMMLSGISGVPISLLPEALRRIAMLLPATHAMNAFRGLAQGLSTDFDPVGSLIILLASGMLAFGLALYLFNWDRHSATQRGHPLLAFLALLPYAIGILLL
jgi:ABC-2 type transport system permease protein